MVNANNIKQIIEFIRFVLITLIAIIVFRLLALSIDIDIFRDNITGKLSTTGYEVKLFQVIIENLTNPLINPVKNIVALAINDKGLINIVAPVFVILMSFVLVFVLSVITPYLKKHIKNKEDDYWGFYN